MIHPKIKLILWRITQIGEEECLENIQVGDESAWGFESLILRNLLKMNQL